VSEVARSKHLPKFQYPYLHLSKFPQVARSHGLRCGLPELRNVPEDGRISSVSPHTRSDKIKSKVFLYTFVSVLCQSTRVYATFMIISLPIWCNWLHVSADAEYRHYTITHLADERAYMFCILWEMVLLIVTRDIQGGSNMTGTICV
jgi:hypothetical protein